VVDADSSASAKGVSLSSASATSSTATTATEVNPFVLHAFLKALEESGSVSAASGWLPRHISVRAM
jgi:predicted N-acyltransferase